jgi:hypothetical protein
VAVYRILGASRAEDRLDVAAATGLTPLVGRASDVARLLARWEQCRIGPGQGYLTQAVRRGQEALALAQALAHPLSLAPAHHLAAYLHHRRQDADEVRARAEALLALATGQGCPRHVGFGTC